jgi:hypothetical protein
MPQQHITNPCGWNSARRFVFLTLLPALLLQAQPPTHPAPPAKTATAKPPTGRTYAGAAACLPCHQQESESYLHTAHHLTSSLPTKESIHGSFAPGSNTLDTSNPNLHFVMTDTPRGFFQTAVIKFSPVDTAERTERFDIVVGSGRKGQTYLFWKDDTLYELPVSYWTELNQWINSPGYPDGMIHFDKPIVPRCLECHGTSFHPFPPIANRYKKSSLVLGITCEKCHGPASEHIALNRSKSPIPQGASQAILNPASFTRDRQMDLCSLCHAGAAEPIAPPLSFVPGDDIKKFLLITDDPNQTIDVHGNQVALLKRSRCFRSSSMTCSTCHNVHTQQRDVASFSKHCLTCHKPEECGKFPELGPSIANNCIDCHMPLQQSQTLISNSKGGQLKPLVRNHQIAIYPAQ